MAAYDVFARFYDEFMGDRTDEAEYVRGLVERGNPGARNVLELACGTGALLAHFAAAHEVTGIDLSDEMLAIARKKVPRARLAVGDMRTFSFSERFDAIVCGYDSINHLLRFEEWQAVIDGAYEHLSDGGVFVFDVNTVRKLRRFEATPMPWVQWSGEDMLAIEVAAGEDGVSVWRIRIFEHVRGPTYRLHVEDIREIAFPVRMVRDALEERFRRVSVHDRERSRPSARSERLYFVCRK